MTDLSIDEFFAVFDRFADSPTSRSVFRWEALQTYAYDPEDESLVAYRTGGPRPERSIRTDPWLARIARSTLAGKQWVRVRYVEEPRSEYTDWELLTHQEAQVAGDQILITRERPTAIAANLGLLPLTDFWLFLEQTAEHNHAVLMHYDEAGAPQRFEHVTDIDRVAELHRVANDVYRSAVPLNDYLASAREALGAH